MSHPTPDQSIRPASAELPPWGRESAAEMLGTDHSTTRHPANVVNQSHEEPNQENPFGQTDSQPGEQPTGTSPDAESGPSQTEEESIELPGGMSPEELRERDPALFETYRSMQADFTRKTQQVADERKEIDDIKKKADAWGHLESIPGMMDLIRSHIAGITQPNSQPPQAVPNPSGQNGQPGEVQVPEAIIDDLGNINQHAFLQAVDQRANQIVEQKMSSMVEGQILPAFQQLYDRERTRTISSLKEQHPDYTNFEPQIEALRTKNPNLSYEDAYKIASHDKQYELGQRRALEVMSSKKRASSQSAPPTGSMVPTGYGTPANGLPLDQRDPLGDAIERAIQQHQSL